MTQYELTQKERDWIEDECSEDTAGFLVSMQTIVYVLNKLVNADRQGRSPYRDGSKFDNFLLWLIEMITKIRKYRW